MCKEIIYFCAELLNYWSMTFFGLKLFAKVYGFEVHKNKIVENIWYALICLPIGITGAVHYYFSVYSIFLTYVLIIYMYIIIKFLCYKKCNVSLLLIALYIFTMRLIDLWIVTVINEVSLMSREVYINLVNCGFGRTCFVVILSLFYYKIYCLCFKNNFIVYLKENKYYYKLSCMYSFFGNSCFNGVYRFDYQEKLINYWSFYLICAFILIGGFWVYFIVIKGQERERFLNLRNDMIESNYYALKKMYDANKTLQHDYKNHMLAVSEFIKDRKIEEALAYIYTYIDYVKESLEDINCGNDIVDIIINSKVSEARDKDISFTYEIDYLGYLNIEDIDLCSLLANLLDNAIEACDAIDDKSKYISLKIFKRNEIIIVQIINTINQCMLKKKEFFKTEKENKYYHGWGMKSIERVVKKYDGIKEYNITSGKIEIFITIPIR